jgi:acyl carrier protein/catechol 2,3-dioxygenase-like lactoylglutathione lyase family enzyme
MEQEDHSDYRTFIYHFAERAESIEFVDFYYQSGFKRELPREIKTIEEQEFVLDHIAIAVTDMEQALSLYGTLGYTCGEITYDPLRRSHLVLCRKPHCDPIELVAAADNHSPTRQITAKNSDIPYHLCYRTKDIRGFLNLLEKQGIPFDMVDDLKPAVLFDYKKVLFLQVKHVGLVELLEDKTGDFTVNHRETVKKNAVRIVVNRAEPSLAFYKLLGYVPVKSINNGKRLEITLSKTGASKIELLVPGKDAVTEQAFLNQNGPHLYQLCFDQDPDQSVVPSAETNITVDYICLRNRKNTKQPPLSQYQWHIKTVNNQQLVHHNQLLPLKNYTASMLLALPTYKVDESTTPGTKYEPPQNQREYQLVEIWKKLLKLERIGVNETFFQLGGNSLKAITLISDIHKAFNVELNLKDIFKNKTIKQLSRRIASSEENIYSSIEIVEKRDCYPLSSAQKRMYLLQQMELNNTTYNMPTAMRLEGQPDKNRFEKTLQALIKRHESFRTSFRLKAGKLVQIIQEKVDFKITYDDLNNGAKEEEIVTHFVKPFDLSQAPLLRVGLIRLSPLQHVFIFDTHHIISDGLSMDILVREFMHLYDENTLTPLNFQYKDFSEWQNRRFESKEIEKLKIYWLEKLSAEIPSLNMPIDYPRPDYQSFAGNTLSFSFPAEKIEKLNSLANEKNITLNFLFISLYFLLLSKYSNQDDIIIGSLVAGRNHPDLEHVMGMFGNFLPIRCKIESNCTFPEFLVSTGKTILEDYENQDYPLEEIIDLLNLPVTLSRNPLFDTMFLFHNQIAPTLHLGIDDLIFTRYPLANRTSKLDFKIDAYVGEEGELNCNLEYNVDLFKEETIKDLIRHFHLLINEVIENPHRKISEIELFTGEEKSALIEKRKLHVTSSGKAVQVAVSATFTSEPIKDYLIWWGKQFGLDIDAAFAPYNRVFQELLDETGVISSNPGINILLVRFEDWIRDLRLSDEEKCNKLEHDFKQMVKIFKDKPKVAPYFVGIFPPATHLYFSSMV